MQKSFDVVIVGASVAGSSLALRLAQNGIKTAIIDKASFPRRKACGEGLSDIALNVLSELGLSEDILSRDHCPFYGYRAWLGNFHVDIASRNACWQQPKGIGIQRYILDEIIVSKLLQSRDVETFFGYKIGKVAKDERGYSVELGDDTLSAKYLVLADGTNSILASRLSVPKKVRNSPSWGISWVFEGEFTKPVENVAIVVKKGFEVYCTPVAKNRVNVCFLAQKHLVSDLAKPQNSLNEISKALEKIQFKGNPIGEPEHIGPIACTRRPIVHDNILLVGDACESLDPISGMGMTHALITSQLVAKSLISILCEKQSAELAFRNLIKERERAVRPFRGFARLTGLLLRSTRNHGRLLALLARTSYPSKIRGVLSPQMLESSLPSTVFALLLAIAGFDISSSKGF